MLASEALSDKREKIKAKTGKREQWKSMRIIYVLMLSSEN
jgi:hypothetical protein